MSEDNQVVERFKICKRCYFFYTEDIEVDARLGIPDEPESSFTVHRKQCHKKSPPWSPVEKDSWCGEWRAMTRADEIKAEELEECFFQGVRSERFG